MTATTENAGPVGVLGLGDRGTMLMLRLAGAGLPAIGVDTDPAAVARCDERVTDAAPSGARRDMVRFAGTPDALARARVVIESVPDTATAKRAALACLDRACPTATALVTTTATRPVSELAGLTDTPARVVGLRLAPAGRLAEVIRTGVTSAAAADHVQLLLRSLGTTPLVLPDRPGSPLNLLLLAFLARAAALCDSGFASAQDIDTAMRLGCGMRRGPLEMLDEIGLEVACRILDRLRQETGRDEFAPAPGLRRLAAEGRGFRRHQGAAAGPARDSAVGPGRVVRAVGVLGSGVMATGIAEVLATAGYDTVLVARDPGRAGIAAKEAAARAARRAGQAGREPGRLIAATSLADLADRDLVIEAVAEDRAVKRESFRRLDETCRPGAVLATTTSSIPVIDCAMATSCPGDVVGMHFFNPPADTGLVEIAGTARTAPDAIATARAVASRLGKHAVVCGDRAGFIVNLLLFPLINDGIGLLAAGRADAYQLDVIGRLGCGLSVGLVRLLDMVGADVAVQILRNLRDEFNDPEFSPAPLLERLASEGFLGNKSGRSVREHPALRKDQE